MELTLRYVLPSGAQVDMQSLEKLEAEQKVSSFEVEDGVVTLSLPPRGQGELFQASFRVVPTLAGTLHPTQRPDLVSYVPPSTWTVR